MNLVAQVLAVMEGLSLIVVGVLESFFYRDMRFHSIFRIAEGEQAAVRLWVVNVGFYNILIGLGALIGVLLINLGDAAAGRALVFFVCGMHVILGPILAVTEPKLWRNAVGEFVLPLLVIVVALVWS